MQNRKSLWVVALGVLAALAAGPVVGDAAHAAGEGEGEGRRQGVQLAEPGDAGRRGHLADGVRRHHSHQGEHRQSIDRDDDDLAVTYGTGGIGGVQDTDHGENTVNVTISKFKKNKIIGTFEGTLEHTGTGASVPVTNGKIKVKVLTTP
jgi:hypothetical protein